MQEIYKGAALYAAGGNPVTRLPRRLAGALAPLLLPGGIGVKGKHQRMGKTAPPARRTTAASTA